MRVICIAALTAVLALGSTLAYADSIPTSDPVIKTGGAAGGGAPVRGASVPSPAGLIVTSFSIFSSSGTSPGTSPCVLLQSGISTTSPACFFENDITVKGSGLAITSLTFDALGVPFNSTDQCGFLSGSPFSSCGVDPLPGAAGTEFTFTQGSIPFHGDFTLDLEGFPKNFTFSATAGTVPEPSTLVMFLTGIGALLVGRRLRVRQSS